MGDTRTFLTCSGRARRDSIARFAESSLSYPLLGGEERPALIGRSLAERDEPQTELSRLPSMPVADLHPAPTTSRTAIAPMDASTGEQVAEPIAPTWNAPDLPPALRGRWSLERRLTLLMFGLLALVVLLFGTVAYRGVRDAAVNRATGRASSLARELAETSTRPSARALALQALASSPLVVAALQGGDADSLVAMQSRRARTDTSLLGWELWAADGTRRVATSSFASRDSLMLAGARDSALRTDAPQRSPLFAVGTQLHSWTVVRSKSGDRPVGVLAELRRINPTARGDSTIRALSGGDVQVYITSQLGGDWVTPGAALVPAPFTIPQGDTASRLVDPQGRAHYAVRALAVGTPWVVVVSQAEATIMAAPRAFLGRIVLVGLLLLAAGTVGAWLLSRRETRPLAQMRDAAEDMARGNYAQHVALAGGAEIASLAHTFNTMATRIGDAHAVLAHQNAALQRANDAKTRFLAVMSHELRTPLNAIGGYTDLLALGIRGPINSVQGEDLARIRYNKDQLLTIVSDVLHFSRADAGHLALDMSDVSLQEQFSDLTETLGQQFHRKGVSLTIDPTDALVHADAARLRQVLCNLLTNALHFTDTGGHVHVSAERSGPQTRIVVRDTGIGIAHDQQAAIFQPFMQVDNSLTRRVGGTGLGLSIVHQLTTAMGGTVSVRSELGHGSTFTVELPTARKSTTLG
jgi:signal transduction histidine kinase